MTLSDSEIDEIKNYINSFRSLHNIPNLLHDENLSLLAQKNANKMVKYKKIIKLNTNEFTELYYLNLISRNNKISNIKKHILKCYNEQYNYDYDNVNDNYNYIISHCFNFTALLWKNSLYFGIGYAYVNGKIAICILISGKGNIQNEYQNNIFPIDN